jgi:hypothetical protein
MSVGRTARTVSLSLQTLSPWREVTAPALARQRLRLNAQQDAAERAARRDHQRSFRRSGRPVRLHERRWRRDRVSDAGEGVRPLPEVVVGSGHASHALQVSSMVLSLNETLKGSPQVSPRTSPQSTSGGLFEKPRWSLSRYPHVMLDRAQPVPPCEKCGGQRKRIGFVPHPDDATQRIDLYRCKQCGDRIEVTAKMREAPRAA